MPEASASVTHTAPTTVHGRRSLRPESAPRDRSGEASRRELSDLLAHRGADLTRVAVVHSIVDARDGNLLHEVVDTRPRAHGTRRGRTGRAQLGRGAGADLGREHDVEYPCPDAMVAGILGAHRRVY